MSLSPFSIILFSNHSRTQSPFLPQQRRDSWCWKRPGQFHKIFFLVWSREGASSKKTPSKSKKMGFPEMCLKSYSYHPWTKLLRINHDLRFFGGCRELFVFQFLKIREPTFQILRFQQIWDHFYSWDPPMSVGKSGLGFALSQRIAEILSIL